MRILYIAGMGRSGSTLLSRMLGQIPGFVSVGELNHLWRTGAPARSADERCGCGRTFATCPHWNAVLDCVFADPAEASEVEALRSGVDRIRYIPWMLGGFRPSSYARRLDAYSRLLVRLYEAIARVSGAEVVVDASKDPSPLYLLSRLDLDVRVLHLLRDPRGIAHSWMKRKRRLEFVDRREYMRRHPSWDSAIRFFYYNALIEAARGLHPAFLRLRYEDVIADPERALRRICRHAGVEPPALDFLKGRVVDLRTADCIVSGNPMRFDRGATELRIDAAWHAGLAKKDRLLVDFITWPFQVLYRYPLLR